MDKVYKLNVSMDVFVNNVVPSPVDDDVNEFVKMLPKELSQLATLRSEFCQKKFCAETKKKYIDAWFRDLVNSPALAGAHSGEMFFVGWNTSHQGAPVYCTCAKWESLCLCVSEVMTVVAVNFPKLASGKIDASNSRELEIAAAAAKRAKREIQTWMNKPRVDLPELSEKNIDDLDVIANFAYHASVLKRQSNDVPLDIAERAWRTLYESAESRGDYFKPTVEFLKTCAEIEMRFAAAEKAKAEGDYATAAAHADKAFETLCSKSDDTFTWTTPKNVLDVKKIRDDMEYIKTQLKQTSVENPRLAEIIALPEVSILYP